MSSARREIEAVAALRPPASTPKSQRCSRTRRRASSSRRSPRAARTLWKAPSSSSRSPRAAKPVTVPDVVGTTSSEATATLRDAGLKVNLVARSLRAAERDRPGAEPGRRRDAKQGSTVRLNVAQARPDTTPTTTTTTTTHDYDRADHDRRLRRRRPCRTWSARSSPSPRVTSRDEGLKVAVHYVPSDEAAGRIVAQAQPAGTERQRGDTVQFNVSVGAQPAAARRVPDVSGSAGGRRGARGGGLRGARSQPRAERNEPGALTDAARRREHPARLARDPLRRRLSRLLGPGSSL